jgi:hypothetical protein
MTREEWKNNESFERIKREMNGIYTEWPTPSEVVRGERGPRTEEEKKERLRIKNAP